MNPRNTSINATQFVKKDDKVKALQKACFEDSTSAVEELLEDNVNPNCVDNSLFGYSPLMVAVSNGNSAMANLLLKFGANINYATATGLTALAVAAVKGNRELAELLVLKGADTNLQFNDKTPREIAAEKGFLEVMIAIDTASKIIGETIEVRTSNMQV